ncbi:MAG: hypothetical protein COU10_00710 [Candidatus Harrisonbacteria bacterium CG10_big_fil_rev_8_21_14_0_10_45_28]|uniref:HTH deoR-type domain-containing protein n=1 Tax=Candidatus Harrisonbacteria bacterium CG10_big_fil_rev_8_21_14_0_10_45_28 TaxID=1974586 RepID=A0A2H0UP08_9BACT|nr:MAG: hypothetical protein COU10_00710 [Candidatus Harrisonbacteria bacterium CG10_big_fil_rev_8_21_14_0_10_45_28]
MEAQINQKSQEIAFALVRIAASIRRFDLKKKFESLAIYLLENCYYRNFDLVADTLRVIEGFLDFGRNVYEVEPMNARIIGEEVSSLRQALEKISNQGPLPLHDIFSSKISLTDLPEPVFAKDNKEMRKNEEMAISSSKPISRSVRTADQGGRQKAIVDFIKETGRLSLKDISTQFPDVTGRTLRYDLKGLIERGLIQRDGSGPASSYFVPEVGSGLIAPKNLSVDEAMESVDFVGPDTVINL